MAGLTTQCADPMMCIVLKSWFLPGKVRCNNSYVGFDTVLLELSVCNSGRCWQGSRYYSGTGGSRHGTERIESKQPRLGRNLFRIVAIAFSGFHGSKQQSTAVWRCGDQAFTVILWQQGAPVCERVWGESAGPHNSNATQLTSASLEPVGLIFLP